MKLIQLTNYHATFKISFNCVKYIVQLFENISCNSERMSISLKHACLLLFFCCFLIRNRIGLRVQSPREDLRRAPLPPRPPDSPVPYLIFPVYTSSS